MGYEAYRELVLRAAEGDGHRLPPDAELSPINPYVGHDEPRRQAVVASSTRVRPWDSLSEDEKRLFCRMAEVYAGFLSHADHEIGRLLDYLEESGQLDNTIIVLVSDNGASGEGGPNGSVNENKFFNGLPDTIEENLKHLDELGGPHDVQPLPDRLGVGVQHAVQDVEALRELRGRHRRPADRLLAAGHRAPPARSGASTRTRSTSCRRSTSASASSCRTSVNGYTQQPLEGISFAVQLRRRGRGDRARRRSSTRCSARARSGTRAGRPRPRCRRRPSRGATSTSSAGSCSTPTTDPSECHDLAAEHPDKLQELIALWWAEAGHVPGAAARVARRDRDPRRPSGRSCRSRAASYIYYPGGAEVPESVAPNIRNRSYTIAAEVDDRDRRRPAA